jgi:O-antigen/teichoic acid export membrane protein
MFACLTILGMHFKAISWALGYIFLAKGNGQLYLIIEVISAIIILLLNLLFYRFYGLNGLGISFILNYFLGMVGYYFILKWKYQFSFQGIFYKRLIVTYTLILFSFLTVFISVNSYRYVAGGIIILIASLFSLFKLNQLMDLKSYILNRLRK